MAKTPKKAAIVATAVVATAIVLALGAALIAAAFMYSPWAGGVISLVVVWLIIFFFEYP